MAVAIKTPPENRPGSPPPSPATLSLLGVAYVVACLALLFKVVPDLWWGAWTRAGLTSYTLLGGSALFTLCVVLAGVFVALGSRLAGAQTTPGVRAGTFVGLCGLLLILLLGRWASLWIEHWAYAANNPFYGTVLTAVVTGGLLLLALRVFFTRGAQEGILAFEEAGWFSTNNYKANQGQMVRRGTIFGILLLAGAGIYTLLLHNTLRRFGPDLSINVPFTGGVAIEGYGDGLPYIADDAVVPPSAKSAVEIRYPGKTNLRVGQRISVDAYKAGLQELVGKDEAGPRSLLLPREARERILAALPKDPAILLDEVNHVIHKEVYEDVLGKGVFPGADTANRIRALDAEADIADKSRVVDFIHREADAHKGREKKPLEIGAELDLPIAVLIVDRFALKAVDAELDPKTHVKIALQNDAGKSITGKDDPALVAKFATGKVVTREDFDAEVARLKKGVAFTPPRAEDAYPPGGPLRYTSLTLLPAIQYTVPLLLIAAALWFAWRAVNMPAFADFLIATEAEMNKVSWTTQKRLYQDTVVVLVTVFLMAVFLFAVDWAWKEILQKLSVLYIPPAAPTQKIEQKKY